MEAMISVIIPLYNHEQFIGPCLESLLSQDIPPGDMEIIVVDNNSQDRGPEIAASYPVLLLHESTQGCIFATAKGLESARGDIIARIDDDCVAHRDWARRIQESFRDPEVNIVMGFTEGINKGLWAELQQRAWESFWFQMGPEGPILCRRGFDTRNFAIRRDLLSQCLGHKVWRRYCADLMMSIILNRLGYSIHFDQRIRAAHHNIQELDALLEKKRIYAADYYSIVAGQPMGFEDPDLPADIRFCWVIDNQHINGQRLSRTLSALKRASILLAAAMRLLSRIPLVRRLLFRLYKAAAGLSCEIGILEEKIKEEHRFGGSKCKAQG